MKKYLLILLMILGGLNMIYAQPGQMNPKREERIQALKVAFITQQLNLSSDEAQRFWPVYNQYDNEMMAVKKDMPELEKQQTILNIKKRYQSNFSNILGAQRTELFFQLDAKFKEKLLEVLRKKRQNNQQPRNRNAF